MKMRHTNRNDFTWLGNSLLFDKVPFMKIEESPNWKNMWYVVYPCGVKSADFYNITRAKENCLAAAMGIKGMEWNYNTEESAV